MAFKIYKGGSELSNKEREILSSLSKVLSMKYSNSLDFCYLFAGFQCGDRQIDALLVKSNAIINIEVKDYSGEKAIATPQGDLVIEPQQERLGRGRGENPFEQVRQQNFTIKNFIFDHQPELFGGKAITTTNEIDVCGFIVLRKIKQVDLSALGSKKSFFRITDSEKVGKDISAYQGRDFVKRNLPMDLDQGFAEKLAHLLDLKEVDELYFSRKVYIELEEKLGEYLSNLIETFCNSNYLHRPELEKELLYEKNIVVTGSPGAGKTSLLKAIVRHRANQLIQKKTQEKLPCFLNLHGDETILEEIQSNFRGALKIDEIEECLLEGKFWIIFDGVDEMPKFKLNFPKVKSFIKRFPKNTYSISVRRGVYDDPHYVEYFKEFKKFENIKVEEFNINEASKLFRFEMGEQDSADNQERFIEFQPHLPDRTPLTIKMTAEILRETNEYAFENIGRFYQRYFSLRLRREVTKTKTVSRGAEELLDDILTVLGGKAIEENSKYFPIIEVLSEIKQEFPDNHLDCYDLLLRSEILSVEGIEITQGNEVWEDNEVKFSHHSFRDYYVAKYLLGVFEDKEKLEMFFNDKDEHNSLVLLCGLEPVREIVNDIISGALKHGLIDLAVDCWSNTRNVFPAIVTKIVNAIINKAEENKYQWIRKCLDFIERYGARIGGEKKLFDFLEKETKDDIILKIEWEILKSEKLGLGEVPLEYRNTLRYVTRNDKTIRDFMPELVYSPEAQSVEGARLYEDILWIAADECFLELALKKTISLPLRVYFLAKASSFDNSSDEIIKGLKANNEFIVSNCEKWMWIVVDVVVQLYGYDDRQEPDELLYHFWDESSPNVQLLILYYIPNQAQNTPVASFFRRVLDEYICDEQVDVDRIEFLSSFHCVSSGNSVFDGFDPIAGDYMLIDFKEETYSTLMKCVAMQQIIDLKITDCKDELVKYTFSENEKLRTVAEWALKQLEESKNE
jgi:GTPase SAR1 family protein